MTLFNSGTNVTGRLGGPNDRNEWRKYCVVPHKGAFRLPGATWDRFRCAVEPLPAHIRCSRARGPGAKKAWKRVENDYFASFFFGFSARVQVFFSGFRLVFDSLSTFFWSLFWWVPNPPPAKPLVAERAFCASEYWGLTRVLEVQGKWQESVDISIDY